MGLREYKVKRDFDRTPEPTGHVEAVGGRSFVIQKHAASHLHYDFRLELEGVLKSWAVPKGPCLDPFVKRLAMHVEDHPVEYGSFEGIIPQGEYGGGTVMLWDRGSWTPVGDPHKGYREGKLRFTLAGEKLHGAWKLIRTGDRSASEEDRRRWLLFKEQDEDAAAITDGDVLDDLPLSVSTGRSLDEIAADHDWTWGQDRTSSKTNPVKSKKTTKRPKAAKAKRDKMPAQVDVELATLTHEAPDTDEWVHEIKFDGYRIVCRIEGDRVALLTRNHHDWTERLSPLVEAVQTLPVAQAIVDGELVALRADGVTDFQELQNAFKAGRADALHYYAFDLLYLDGVDLTGQPLEERKRHLRSLLGSAGVSSRLHLSEHIEGHGGDFLKQARLKGLEGIVSKRRDSRYVAGRGSDWLKVKCLKQEEFVIGGYTDPTGSRTGFGALLLGSHSKEQLHYAGKVGTGFDDDVLQSLAKRLRSLEQDASPFGDRKARPRGTHWVEPELVAQVVFSAKTREGILRHSSFQGLREDKDALEVVEEKALPLSKLSKKTHARTSSSRVQKSVSKVSSSSNRVQTDHDLTNERFAGVRLTSPDKVLYPEAGITKLDLASYYRDIAPWIIPHLVDRPLVLVRCPEGREQECFFQKHPGVGTPDTLRQISVREKTKTEQYVVVDDVAGMISLAQVGALEIHAWGSRADKLEQPDRLIFDLDPDTALPWKTVVHCAKQVREFLLELGLQSFVKSTGGKGLHLVVPIRRHSKWDDAKAFCKSVADVIVSLDSNHFTANMAKAARGGKIFIDYLRNGRGATGIAPYSPRARPNAPVSVPLKWQELDTLEKPDHYTISNLRKRLEALETDPWTGIDSMPQGLTAPGRKLKTLARI